MKDHTDRLSLLHSELELLEAETFEIEDHAEMDDGLMIPSTTSTTSSTTSCTSSCN